MKNLDLLLQHVKPVNHYYLFGHNRIDIKEEILSGAGIYQLLEHIKWMEFQGINAEIEVTFKCNLFKSSDVVSVIEIIMLYTAVRFPGIFKYNFAHFRYLETNILFRYSLLTSFNNKKIGKSFENSFYEAKLELNHYRQVVQYEDGDDSFLCEINDNIKYTIKNVCNNLDLACEAAESCIEMIGNVLEHSKTDCIVDVKISENTDDRIYLSLNVVSLSDVFIGQKLMELFDCGNGLDFSGSSIVLKAYSNHKKLFNQIYDYSAFAFVCSFQNSVSTRENVKNSGGTGFTTLIRNIHDKSFNQQYDSYILSGKNTLYFKNEFLNMKEDGILGFNKKNDFYNEKPDESILKKENIAFPGTIFCVNLITEKL